MKRTVKHSLTVALIALLCSGAAIYKLGGLDFTTATNPSILLPNSDSVVYTDATAVLSVNNGSTDVATLNAGTGNLTVAGDVTMANGSTFKAETLKAVDASGLDFLNDDGLPILSLGDNLQCTFGAGIRTTIGALTVMNTGVSVDGAGTNVMPYAESIPTSGWTISNNTASPATFTYQTVDGIPELYVTDVVYAGNTPNIKTTATGSASSYYALSFEARCDTGSASLSTAVRISGTDRYYTWYLTNEWKRYTWTISYSGAANNYVRIFFNNSVSGGDGYHLRRIQLEPVATATSPSTGFIPGGMTRNAGDVVLGHDLTLLTGGANLQDATVEGTLTLGDSGQQVSVNTTNNTVQFGNSTTADNATVDCDDGTIKTNGKFNLSAGSELTVSSNAVTVTKSRHSVTAASPTALNTINGGVSGDMLYLSGTSAAVAVTVTDGAGNIQCGANVVLDSANDWIQLLYDGSNWQKISSSVDN